MSAPSFALRGVEVRRSGRVILTGVNLTARAGELLVLRGASGSGKTTLLRAMAGLDAFQAGAIEIGDARISAPGVAGSPVERQWRRRVGLVFQFHCLFEHLSAIENVALAPVHVYRTPRADAERRARAILGELGVEPRAAALPRHLSGGEAQRVAIARALAVDPPVLLMDEPMASLDPARRQELGLLLQRLAGTGRTLLVTSHDEGFAAQFGSRILEIEGGTVG